MRLHFTLLTLAERPRKKEKKKKGTRKKEVRPWRIERGRIREYTRTRFINSTCKPPVRLYEMEDIAGGPFGLSSIEA